MCNCNNNHRVVTVTNNTTSIDLTVTNSTNIGSMERFNLICYKPISALVTGSPIPVTISVNGVTANVKNAYGLPLMSNVVPLGKTCGTYVLDDSGEAPVSYVILKTPKYA